MNGKDMPRYTLEDVLEQRDKALQDVCDSGKRLSGKVHDLFAPPKENGKFDLVANNIDRLLAIYDGVMLGTKVIKRIRRLFLHR